jgi:hypothetical protein
VSQATIGRDVAERPGDLSTSQEKSLWRIYC